MKKVLLILCFLAGASFAQIGVSLGVGPSQGMIGVGYTMLDGHLSANVHLATYNSDYDFMGGIGIAYRFTGLTGPYAFHSSEWITGEMNGFTITNVGLENSELIEHTRDINYWRLVFGLGYQHMLLNHFGAYFEMGFEFYAGNGGYYTHFDAEYGTLDNDKLFFPVGLGLVVEF